MAEEKEERSFDELMKEVLNHVMGSEDEELIVLVDKLYESAERLKAEREKLMSTLRQISEKAIELGKEVGKRD